MSAGQMGADNAEERILQMCSRQRSARDIAVLLGDVRSIDRVEAALRSLKDRNLVEAIGDGDWRRVDAGHGDVASTPESRGPVAIDPLLRAAARTALVVSIAWLIAAGGLLVFGVYLVAHGVVNPEGGGIYFGIPTALAGAAALRLALWARSRALAVGRTGRDAGVIAALMVVHTLAAAGAVACLVITVQVAEGDDHTPDALFVGAWSSTAFSSALAVGLLAIGAMRDRKNG